MKTNTDKADSVSRPTKTLPPARAKSPKLTQWFPIAVKPKRIGTYNVSCKDAEQSGDYYSHFDGAKFSWYERDPRYVDPTDAFMDIDRTRSWRGLASNPARKP